MAYTIIYGVLDRRLGEVYHPAVISAKAGDNDHLEVGQGVRRGQQAGKWPHKREMSQVLGEWMIPRVGHPLWPVVQL